MIILSNLVQILLEFNNIFKNRHHLFEFLYFIFCYLLPVDIIKYFFYFIFKIIIIDEHINNNLFNCIYNSSFYILINHKIN